jgi:tetratricopeptide (TPR) repeat protein
MEQGLAWSRREQAAVRRIGDPAQARAQALHTLGMLYEKDGKYAMAANQYGQAVTLVEETQPRSARLASYYHDWANSEHARGDYQSARTRFELALDISLEQHGDLHPKVARLQQDFAPLLLALDEGDQARTMLETALTTSKQLYGSEHYLLGKILIELSKLETWAGDFARARAHALEAQRILDDGGFASDHPRRAYIHRSLGTMALHQRDFAAARAAFESALAIHRHHLGDRHLAVAWTRALLAESLLGLERYEDTIAQCDAAQASTAGGAGVTTELRARLLSIRGRALLGRGDVEPAIGVLDQAVSQYRQIDGFRWERAAALWALARALRAGGNDADARARVLAEEARAIYELRGNADALVHQDIVNWLDEHDEP